MAVHFALSAGAVPVGMFSVKFPAIIAALGTCGANRLAEDEPEAGVRPEEEQLIVQNRTADGETEAGAGYTESFPSSGETPRDVALKLRSR